MYASSVGAIWGRINVPGNIRSPAATKAWAGAGSSAKPPIKSAIALPRNLQVFGPPRVALVSIPIRFALFTLQFFQPRFNVIHPTPLVGGQCSRTVKALQNSVRPGKINLRLSSGARYLAQ